MRNLNPVGAALAAALDSKQNQVLIDKHFATKHRLINDFKRIVFPPKPGSTE
jgi:hypothetical protein